MRIAVIALILLAMIGCAERPQVSGKPKFVIYTKPGCPRCERSLQILNSRGINFQEKSISESENQKEMWTLIRNDEQGQATRVTLPVVNMDSVLYYNLQDLEQFFQGI